MGFFIPSSNVSCCLDRSKSWRQRDSGRYQPVQGADRFLEAAAGLILQHGSWYRHSGSPRQHRPRSSLREVVLLQNHRLQVCVIADLWAALKKSHPALPSIPGHTLLLLSSRQTQRLCGYAANKTQQVVPMENQPAKKEKGKKKKKVVSPQINLLNQFVSQPHNR